MRVSIPVFVVAMAFGAVAQVESAAAAGRCVVAGGSADMITRDLSVFMAKAALGNSIKGMGAKPVGPVKLTCNDSFPVHCLAKQKACK